MGMTGGHVQAEAEGGDEGSTLEDSEVRIPLGECVLDSPNFG